MTDDDLKKIQKSIKDELRPVKEVAEILKSKVGNLELFQRSTASTVRAIKDQQSVINEKLDDMTNRLDEMKTSLDANTASVMGIEATIKGYGDMYKINKHNIERVDTRTTKIEKHLNIVPSEDLKVPHFSAE